MVAPLSFQSQYGYYNLRVTPSFEQVVGTVRKPLRVPLPDRSAKWYALGPYRALILDAEQKYHDYEHAAIDYRQSGAELPEAAARVRPSDAGHDQTFDRYDREHEARQAQDAYKMAYDLNHQEIRHQTAATRREQLSSTYGANHMHPTVEASHDELAEAGAPHYMPAPRPPPPFRSWPTPPEQFVSSGQPQAPEFPTFESLNTGQHQNLRVATLSRSQNMTYERMRDFVVEPTWSY